MADTQQGNVDIMSENFLDNLVLKWSSEAELRIQRIKKFLLGTRIPEISIHRARLFTDGYRKNEAEPAAIRKAKAFYYVLENIPIPVIEDQLIAGSAISFYGAIEIDPEYYTGWLSSDSKNRPGTQLRNLPLRGIQPVEISQEDLRILEEEILPYWKDKYLGAYIYKDMEASYPQELEFINKAQVFMTNFGKGFSHTVEDYNSVVTKGLKEIKNEIICRRDKLAKNLGSEKDSRRLEMYEAMIICAEAVMLYARRCAKVYEEKSLSAAPEKKKELMAIADICKKVPEFPARSWWEALQAIHFMHMTNFLTESGVSHSLGRMDYYLYPLYKKWVKASEEKEKAQELLECFFLKCYEYQSVRDEKTGRGLAGDRTNDKITLGGIDEKGNDITNELTYRFLEAQAHVHLKEPNLSLRLHKGTPQALVDSALEVVRLGSGLPQFINDDVIIPSLVSHAGVLLEDARHYADLGCQENITDPNSSPVSADTNGHNNAGFFNLAKVVELTLYNGINPMNNAQVGPNSGKADSFKVMDEFSSAFIKQLRYAVEMNVLMNSLVERHFSDTLTNPYLSLMHPGPRSNGFDYAGGGCRYNWIGAVGVGLATAADSLMAIEELVFKRKSCSMNELLLALEANWKGFEGLRNISLSLSRYGASGKRAQFWAKWLVDNFSSEYEKHRIKRGDVEAKFVIGLFSMGIYLVLGEDVSATPDGRFAREMLSGSVAPSQYAEALGYTATHNAAADINTQKAPNGIVFNQVMPFNIVSRHDDLIKWGALLRTYFELGGMSVQYSVVDRDELKKAQSDPGLYKDLIVRVGGYSARFIDLSKPIQDDFIARAC
ncbi:hypothetical protein EPN54_05280 [bacterium]|nr:MAG: hypothetical protein EPN54_05280 [bacterium]